MKVNWNLQGQSAIFNDSMTYKEVYIYQDKGPEAEREDLLRNVGVIACFFSGRYMMVCVLSIKPVPNTNDKIIKIGPTVLFSLKLAPGKNQAEKGILGNMAIESQSDHHKCSESSLGNVRELSHYKGVH